MAHRKQNKVQIQKRIHISHSGNDYAKMSAVTVRPHADNKITRPRGRRLV